VPRRIAHFRSDGDGKGESPRRRAQRWLMRRLIRAFATDVVAVSPAALEFAGPLDGTRVRTEVIPSGLDTDRIRRLLDRPGSAVADRPTRKLLVHVGRPKPDKNRALAVEVLRSCRSRGLDVSLALVGPTEPEEVAVFRRQLGPEAGRLLVLGERDDVPAVLAEADAVLMTSVLEGLPGVILESCAVGTPCVASDLPGARWIAEELPGSTRLVGLDQPIDTWVDAVEESLALPRAEVEKSVRRVEESVFAMPRAISAFERLWSGP
jgi:glycosyltransferase involved in cell wall biosynthesis